MGATPLIEWIHAWMTIPHIFEDWFKWKKNEWPCNIYPQKYRQFLLNFVDLHPFFRRHGGMVKLHGWWCPPAEHVSPS
jgi:hypothetical protein